MVGGLGMMHLVVVIILFGLFSAFAWRETATDERQNIHRMLAGRIAFLTGSAILMLAILVQDLAHAIDPWLVIALAGMVLAKAVGLAYSRITG